MNERSELNFNLLSSDEASDYENLVSQIQDLSSLLPTSLYAWATKFIKMPGGAWELQPFMEL